MQQSLVKYIDELKLTTAQKASIESELNVASNIQMSMLPSVFPNREGLDMHASMTPAKEVGGDLYGYLLKGDALYFCVGDVSGKGVPASLFMAQVTRLFRTLANQQMTPADICTQMNEALSGDENPTCMFVTLFMGLLDLQTGHLQFCNAGHNPPVIGGGEHHGEFLKMLPNFPIGVMPGLEFTGEEIDTIKGRPLFLYTDGLNEAENRQHAQFGDDQLLSILRNTHFESAQQVVETLYNEVQRHRDGADPNDDLTMMCLRMQ
jgi:sigma-B regulation protein RsbU (phosphoserine phosphatase)